MCHGADGPFLFHQNHRGTQTYSTAISRQDEGGCGALGHSYFGALNQLWGGGISL